LRHFVHDGMSGTDRRDRHGDLHERGRVFGDV
jgi:hypothetical protein